MFSLPTNDNPPRSDPPPDVPTTGYPSPSVAAVDHSGPFFNPTDAMSAQLAVQALPLAQETTAGEMPSIDALAEEDDSELQDPVFGGSIDETVTPRKRSKVSRACDECRRKKIKCDATTENGEPCTSCKRTATKCSFTRQPMKRGPSKGYIKELADRLNSLENSINTEPYPTMGDEGISPRASTDLSPGSPLDSIPKSRKRTLSTANELYQNISPRSTRLPSIVGSQWQPELARHLPPPTNLEDSPFRAQYSPSGVPFWKPIVDFGRKPSGMDDTRASTDSAADLLEWDERTVEEYYDIIHPTFPFLSPRPRLRSRLANCPVTLREAFLEALYTAVRSNPASKWGHPTSLRKAIELINASQLENSATRTLSTNLVFLQALILITLGADSHAATRIGPPRSTWLGSAIGLAYHLKLHITRVRERSDPDSDDIVGRRIWWTLVILDRWQACSTASPVFIPESSAVLLPADQVLLGPTTYHLARLSAIVGHLAEIFISTEDLLSPTTPSGPLIGRLLHGEIDRFRESVESDENFSSLLFLAYWHVKLLARRHSIVSEPSDILDPALRIATILNSAGCPITPLHHHFTVLAAVTLVELSENLEVRDRALKGLQMLLESLDKTSRSPTAESNGWDNLIRELVAKRRLNANTSLSGSSGSGSTSLAPSHGTLLHLADLAVGRDSPQGQTQLATPSSSTSAPMGAPPAAVAAANIAAEKDSYAVYDFTTLTRLGYLTFLIAQSSLS